MDLNKFNANANNSKLNNLFLGFFEGLFLDGQVNTKEIESLIKWVETYPECCELTHFDSLYQLLVNAKNDPNFLTTHQEKIKEVIYLFKTSKYFISGTADIQRLHGILSGLSCDQEINTQEIIQLKVWLQENTHLSTDPIYEKFNTILKSIRSVKNIKETHIQSLKSLLTQYIQIDNFGLPRLTVTSDTENQNPDFYHGSFNIQNNTFCLTGASTRYTKAEWKEIIENKGGLFNDDLRKSVNFLVICNKGNPHWAHMSYGRKFEQALKWQKEGLDLKILTEDDFVQVLDS